MNQRILTIILAVGVVFAALAFEQLTGLFGGHLSVGTHLFIWITGLLIFQITPSVK